MQLFASRGYDAVGVQEIVDAAGITKPTLYHYFGSKRGLLEALLGEPFGGLIRSVEQAADYHGDLPLTLEKVVRAYFDFAQGHRTFYRMQLAMWFAPPQSDAFQVVSRFDEQQHQVIERLFVLAAQNHGNMKDRQRAYAATFLGMINTYIGLSLNDYAVLDDRLVYLATKQFMHGIFS